jgi:hypothetical protein
MDLFNRKKVKMLQSVIDSYEQDMERNSILSRELISSTLDMVDLYKKYKYWFNVLSDDFASDMFDFEGVGTNDSIKELVGMLEDVVDSKNFKGVTRVPGSDMYTLNSGKVKVVVFDKVLPYKEQPEPGVINGMRNIRLSFFEDDNDKPYYSAWIKFGTDSTMSESIAKLCEILSKFKKNKGDVCSCKKECNCGKDKDLNAKCNANDLKDDNVKKKAIKETKKKKGKRGRPRKK